MCQTELFVSPAAFLGHVEVAIVGDKLSVQLGRRIMKLQRIQLRYGRTITKNRSKLYRWCFSDLSIARAFNEQFGGDLYKHGIK